MSSITFSANPIQSGARTGHSMRWLALGLVLIPIVLGAGAAIDSFRASQFKARLANLANEAAIEGAIVYVDRGSAPEARAVATSYFHSKHAPLSGQTEPPHVKVLATPAAAYGQKGYGVTVEVTAKPSYLFPTVFGPVETVSISAFAINPIDPVNYARGNFRVEAKSAAQARFSVLAGG